MVKVQDYLRTGKHGKAVAMVRASRYCVLIANHLTASFNLKTINQ